MGGTRLVFSNVSGSIRWRGSTGIKPMISGISRSPFPSKVNFTLRSPVFSTRVTF